jgi:murein DD-endopeptidase MepM/ murein hydrolase activator NlpD
MARRPLSPRSLIPTIALLALGATRLTPVAAQAPTVPPATVPPATSPPAGFQLEDGSPELDQLVKQIDQAKARRQQLDAQQAELGRQVRSVEQEVQAAEAKVVAAQAQERALQGRLNATRLELAAAKEEMRKRAVAAYIKGPTASNQYVDLLLHVHSVHELTSTAGYVTASLEAQSKAVARHLALSREVERLHDRLAAARDEAIRQRDAVATRKRILDATRQSMTRLGEQLSSVIEHQGQLVGKVFESRDAFLAELNAFQEQSNAIGALLRYRQSGQEAAAPGAGTFSLPIPDAPIVSAFGPRVHPIFGDVRMHEGIDLGAASGTPIAAAADGVVVSAGPLGGYGNATVIDHGNALATLYGHQSVLLVKPGDPVARGQLIGAVGCTGLCTGAHLHFEVRVNGTPVDPINWL